MGKFIAGLLAVAGIIAGPGYFFYVHSYSGERVGTFEISGRVSRLALPGGFGVSVGRGGAFKPFSVDLDPKMNPLSFSLSGKMAPNVDNATFRARLFAGNRTVLDKGVWLSRHDKNRANADPVSSDLGRVNVESPGQYHFVLEEPTLSSRENVTGISVEVRRNVRDPNMRIVWTGVALLVIGCMIGSFLQKPSVR